MCWVSQTQYGCLRTGSERPNLFFYTLGLRDPAWSFTGSERPRELDVGEKLRGLRKKKGEWIKYFSLDSNYANFNIVYYITHVRLLRSQDLTKKNPLKFYARSFWDFFFSPQTWHEILIHAEIVHAKKNSSTACYENIKQFLTEKINCAFGFIRINWGKRLKIFKHAP